jgi:hypothetical protein
MLLSGRRQITRALSLVGRRPGEVGPDTPPAAASYADRWWEGRVEGQPVALNGGLWLRFRGQVLVGRYAWSNRIRLERPARRRRGPLTRTIGSDRGVGSLLEPVLEAASRLSPAVRSLEVAPNGLRCVDYGSAGHGTLVADLTVLAGLLNALTGLPDPPLLAAVKAGDLDLVRERLAAGDDANQAGPRDCTCPGDVGERPETPLLAALLAGRVDLVRMLIEHSGLDPHDASTTVSVAVALQRLDLLDTILTAGRLHLRDYDLFPGLSRAVTQSWPAGVERLLQAGADPSKVDLPTGPVADKLREVLEGAREERRRGTGPLAEARAHESGLRRLVARWRDRTRAALPWLASRPGPGWSEAARELGLRPSGGRASPRLEGTVDGIGVRVEVLGAGATRVTRIAAGGVPAWLGLRPESLREKLGWAKANDVLVRWVPFDERIDVQGPVAECLALLSQPVRTQVLDFVDGLGGTVGDGEARLDLAGLADDRPRLVRSVRAALELARALATRAEKGIATCLAENVATDPSDSVRTTMLAALAERFPGAEETLEASRLALRTGRYDWLRMTAAANLGDEGTAFYREILADTTQSPAVRGMALRHLGWRGGTAAEELVLGYLDDPAPDIVLHAVRILGERAGGAASVVPLQRLAGPLPTSEIARAAARAVETIQSRLVNADPGQLSLADAGQDGELSLTPGREGGEVSLAVEKGETHPGDRGETPDRG